MKKYLKSVLFGILIGFSLIPIMFLQIYYWAGYEQYLYEITRIKNLECLLIVTPIIGILIITFAKIFVNLGNSLENSDKNVKGSIKYWIIQLLIMFLCISFVSAIPELVSVFSENIKILISLNYGLGLILAAIIFIIIRGLEIRKINKKLNKNKE